MNPVSGAVGLLSTGNWQICQAAVETVLSGGVPRPVTIGIPPPSSDEGAEAFAWGGVSKQKPVMHGAFGCLVGDSGGEIVNCMENTASLGSGISELSPEVGDGGDGAQQVGNKKPKLLNLFG